MAAELYDQLRLPGELQHTGIALARFVEALKPDGNWEKSKSGWIYEPEKFVVFKIQPKEHRYLASRRLLVFL